MTSMYVYILSMLEHMTTASAYMTSAICAILSAIVPFLAKLLFSKGKKHNILHAIVWAIVGLFVFEIGITMLILLSNDM